MRIKWVDKQLGKGTIGGESLLVLLYPLDKVVFEEDSLLSNLM